MHAVVDELRRAWGLALTVLPMSDDPVRTAIDGPDGEIPFQDYMVKLRTEVEVKRVRFEGAAAAKPAPGVIDAITGAESVLVAPSNPFVSIGPILAVPGIREALAATKAVRVAISPIIAGQVVKGPAGKMLASLGHEVSALGVARIYRDSIDVMVIDEQDRALAPAVEALGLRCLVTDTIMADDAKKKALAEAALRAARR
jgi:LPPG:FO 2-phospho-L-lactate transferase